jgi:hypothetical protein
MNTIIYSSQTKNTKLTSIQPKQQDIRDKDRSYDMPLTLTSNLGCFAPEIVRSAKLPGKIPHFESKQDLQAENNMINVSFHKFISQ